MKDKPEAKLPSYIAQYYISSLGIIWWQWSHDH